MIKILLRTLSTAHFAALRVRVLPLALALALAFCPGCATSYKTEKAADITVSAAMTAWGNYVAQYHPSVADEQRVKAAFEKYQAAEILAIDATQALFDLSQSNSAAGSSATNSAPAQAQAAAAAQAAAQALADLVSLLQTFGIQIAVN